MHIQLKLQYLGQAEPVRMKDGSTLYKVSFFDAGAGAPVTLNVMDSREDILSVLRGCKFGTVLDCRFSLTPKDNLYRLSLVFCEVAGK